MLVGSHPRRGLATDVNQYDSTKIYSYKENNVSFDNSDIKDDKQESKLVVNLYSISLSTSIQRTVSETLRRFVTSSTQVLLSPFKTGMRRLRVNE